MRAERPSGQQFNNWSDVLSLYSCLCSFTVPMSCFTSLTPATTALSHKNTLRRYSLEATSALLSYLWFFKKNKQQNSGPNAPCWTYQTDWWRVKKEPFTALLQNLLCAPTFRTYCGSHFQCKRNTLGGQSLPTQTQLVIVGVPRCRSRARNSLKSEHCAWNQCAATSVDLKTALEKMSGDLQSQWDLLSDGLGSLLTSSVDTGFFSSLSVKTATHTQSVWGNKSCEASQFRLLFWKQTLGVLSLRGDCAIRKK